MKYNNYENHKNEDFENTEAEKRKEVELQKGSVQAQFAGYYYDGKSNAELSKKYEKFLINE